MPGAIQAITPRERLSGQGREETETNQLLAPARAARARDPCFFPELIEPTHSQTSSFLPVVSHLWVVGPVGLTARGRKEIPVVHKNKQQNNTIANNKTTFPDD